MKRFYAALGLIMLGCGGSLPSSPPPVPTPVPSSTPAPVEVSSCETLTRWTSGIHNITDGNNKVVDKPTIGGNVVVDSTPLYGGAPCNLERPCGQVCEDPRGAVWELIEGTANVEIREHGYQFRISSLHRGLYRWRVCPQAPPLDGQGLPVAVGPNPCSEGSFSVEE